MFERINNQVRALILSILPLLLFLTPRMRETVCEHWIINGVFGLLYAWRVWATVREESGYRFYHDLEFKKVFPLMWPLMAFLPWETQEGSRSPKWSTYILILWVPVLWFVVGFPIQWLLDNYAPAPIVLTQDSWLVVAWNWFGEFYRNYRASIWVGLAMAVLLFLQYLRNSWRMEHLKEDLNKVALSWKYKAEMVDTNWEKKLDQETKRANDWAEYLKRIETENGPDLAAAIVSIRASKKLVKDPRMAKAKDDLVKLLFRLTNRNRDRAQALLWEAQVAMDKATEASVATPPAVDTPMPSA